MPVVVEVDAAHAVLAPAVKLPQIKVAGAEVVVDDVQDHRQAGSMRRFDEPLEAGRAAVVGFHGKNARGVVSPRQLAGELGQGHHFDDVHAQSLQMVEFLHGFGELVRLSILFVVKGSQVHFINHQFVDRGEVEIVAFPVKVRVVDHRVSHRTGDLAGIGVDAQQFLVAVDDAVAILVADGGRGDVRVPVTVPLLHHGVGVGRPIVERADDAHRIGVGSPYTKRDARLVKDRSHPGEGFLDCGC